MKSNRFSFSKSNRRELLRAGMYGVCVTAGASMPLPVFGQAAAQLAGAGKANGKILVVLELSGGNDGLNTLVPYGDDAYYKHRPNLGIPAKEVRKIDDHFGFSRGMAGFERLYKDGKLAIVHGCGYENPSFSHFTSMAYWHTAAPNSGEEYGWVGRLADAMSPGGAAEFSGEHRRAPIAGRAQPEACARGVRRSEQVFAGEVLRREGRSSMHCPTIRMSTIRRGDSCSTPRAARRTLRCWCRKPGPSTTRRWTTGSPGSICPRWRR